MNSKRMYQIINDNKLDAIISESPQTRQWFTGLDTSAGWLIIEPKEATLFIDGRYIEYAKKHAKNVNVHLFETKAGGTNTLKEWLAKKRFNKVGLEKDYLTVANKLRIMDMLNLKDDSIVLVNAQEFRIIKTEEEIAKIQKAIDISLESFEKVKEYLKEGVSEKEIQNKIEYIMTRLGADKEGYDTIVAFGKSAAEPHHHSAAEVTLKDGDIVTIDFGAKYQGYVADITRTFIYGQTTNEKYKEIMEIVDEAARLGREAVKPGIKASEVDAVCRNYIASKGYSNFFVHSTGHGIGLDVHEFPNVSFASDIVLEEGMVLTIEPGIYLEGIGGARTEDDVLVTKDGHRVLTRK